LHGDLSVAHRRGGASDLDAGPRHGGGAPRQRRLGNVVVERSAVLVAAVVRARRRPRGRRTTSPPPNHPVGERRSGSAGVDTRVGTEHLLPGVLDEGGNLALEVLVAIDVDPDDVASELVASLGAGTKAAGDRASFAPLAKKALEQTTREAHGLGHNYVGCEHL